MERITFTQSRFTMSIPVVALKTYQKKYDAVERMKVLGGIHAPMSSEVDKLMRTIRSCTRKINREGWWSTDHVSF